MSLSNHDIKVKLIKEYGYLCMAGGEIDKQHNPLTMHHIIPKHDYGKNTLYNGSNIAYKEHSGIHVIDLYSKTKFKTIQEQLRYYKEFKDELSRLQFHQWLLDEMEYYGFEEHETKDKYLMYKRK